MAQNDAAQAALACRALSLKLGLNSQKHLFPPRLRLPLRASASELFAGDTQSEGPVDALHSLKSRRKRSSRRGRRTEEDRGGKQRFSDGVSSVSGRFGKALRPGPRQHLGLGARSAFFDEFGFQTHGAESVDLAIDVVIAVHQADVFDLGAHLQGRGASLHLQILDEGDGIPVLQHIPVGVPDDQLRFGGIGFQSQGPFVSAFRTNEHPVAFVGVLGLAFGTVGQIAQGFRSFAAGSRW